MDCLFCGFVNKRSAYHKRGYPFIINHETRNTLSFVALDSPVNDEAQLVIIPKAHYKDFNDIPDGIKRELIAHISLAGKYYSSKGRGYNILLNNTKAAGQFIPHSHFHVIPRRRGDGIKIEIWKRKKISPKAFTELAIETSAEFKRRIEK